MGAHVGDRPVDVLLAKSNPVSARAIRDALLMPIVLALWPGQPLMHGARKFWKAGQRAGHDLGRDQVACLMRNLGIRGVRRGRRVITTRRNEAADRAPDLVCRAFTAIAPLQRLPRCVGVVSEG